MVTYLTTPGGEDLVVIPRRDYERLVAEADPDARAAARALTAIRAGQEETLSEAEVDALCAAVTPLAFWRAKRGMTQAALARAVGRSQSYLAQIEKGTRRGDPAIYLRLARALGVTMEDLVLDETPSA